MSITHTPDPIVDPERLFEGFENLMPFRVQDILLVSSLYDSFILREDGRLNELLIGQSLELNLSQVPGITHVSKGAEALALARSQPRFNLIVTNLEVEDMDAAQLAREVKAAGLDVPVVVLAYDYREIEKFIARNPVTEIERVFLWQGNARILISIVKYIEDKRNVLHDTRAIGVPVILVVEDNIRYYSSFLPTIYTELITQSRRLLSEGLNVAHKLVRMRARPKILLASNYEDAARQVMQHREYLLGLVSDVEFPRDGALNVNAGFDLAHMVRGEVPEQVRRSMELWVGCIAGALQEHEYATKLARAGFDEIDIEATRVYCVEDARKFLSGEGIDVDAVAAQVENKFMSAFIRAVKPAAQEARRT